MTAAVLDAPAVVLPSPLTLRPNYGQAFGRYPLPDRFARSVDRAKRRANAWDEVARDFAVALVAEFTSPDCDEWAMAHHLAAYQMARARRDHWIGRARALSAADLRAAS